MGAKSITKRVLRRTGFELQRYSPEGSYSKRRQLLIEKAGVNTVLDVGAHAGEFALSLRHTGYSGRIVSFEPIATLYARLSSAANTDHQWSCQQIAVGNKNGKAEIHISGNDGFSSSIREMAQAHKQADPNSAYVTKEVVSMKTLDDLSKNVLHAGDQVFLKVDTQGYEPEVISGGQSTLKRCQIAELELGFIELYEGQELFSSLIDRMEIEGFYLTDLEPGFRDKKTGQLLQVDALFARSAFV